MNSRVALAAALWLTVCLYLVLPAPVHAQEAGEHEAMFYEKMPDGRVQCTLCPRRCVIAEGQRGMCRNRENREAVLRSEIVY